MEYETQSKKVCLLYFVLYDLICNLIIFFFPLFSRDLQQALILLRRFPNMDIDALKEKYPSVDVEKVKRYKRAQGHFVS